MIDLSTFISQLKTIATQLSNSIPFMIQHKLWEGFFKQKAVLSISIIAAIIIPYNVYNHFSTFTSNILSQKQGIVGVEMVQNSFLDHINGSNKYLVLILLHMLNVYFSNKTIEKLSGTFVNISFKELIHSQFRNLIVIIRNWIYELIIGIAISIVLGVFGPEWLEDILKFLIGSYFIGFIYLDNYNAAFKIPIKTSSEIVYNHIGAAFGLGIVAKILFILPFVGPILASFVCGVAGTWYMHTSINQHLASEAYSD
jgi:hypothetical protein